MDWLALKVSGTRLDAQQLRVAIAGRCGWIPAKAHGYAIDPSGTMPGQYSIPADNPFAGSAPVTMSRRGPGDKGNEAVPLRPRGEVLDVSVDGSR